MDDNERIRGLRRDWTAPRELAGSMREVRLSGYGIAVLALAAAFALGGIAAGVGLSRLAASQDAKRRTLDEQGVNTQAVITRLWRTDDKDPVPMVAYEFPYEGRVYRGQAAARDRTWRGMAQGEPIEVRFVPSDPTLNHPAAWRQATVPGWLGVPVAAVLFAIAGMLWLLVRRQTALLSEGRPAPALVTRHVRNKDGKYWHYEFPLSGLSSAKGRGGPSHNPPAIGAVVCILYNPEMPKRNAPYPLKLVRIDRG